MTPWYRFLTDLGDRSGETAIISIRRTALAIRAKQILIARAETNAPLADFQCKSQSSSGYKNGKMSYCRETAIISIRRAALAIRAKQNHKQNLHIFKFLQLFHTTVTICGQNYISHTPLQQHRLVCKK